MIPTTERTLIFEDEFILTDNFYLTTEPEHTSSYISTNYPFIINFTMVLFCTQGSMCVQLNLKEYRLKPHDTLIVLPGSIGQCKEFSPDCQVAIIAGLGNNLFNDNNSPHSILFRKHLINWPQIHISSNELQEFLVIYHLMRRKIEQPDSEFTREALIGFMQVLTANGYQWLSRHYKNIQNNKNANRQQQLFDNFLSLVQKHYGEQRRIGFYANKMCLTPKYLSQVIHQVSGRYAGDWIDDYVILEAKALLKSKKYTIQQICDTLNFSNTSFFGKYFKEAVGCSPRRYMLQ